MSREVVVRRADNGWIVEHNGVLAVEQGLTADLHVVEPDGAAWEVHAIFHPASRRLDE